MSCGKDELVERKRRDLRRLVTPLQDRLQAQVALLFHIFRTEGGPQHDVGHEIERFGERTLGDIELHRELLGARPGVELRAKESEFALERVCVARSRAFGEHARGEARESGLIAFEPRPAFDDERDVDERQRVMLDDLQSHAVRELAGGDSGEIELGTRAECGRFGAVEGALSLSTELEC